MTTETDRIMALVEKYAEVAFNDRARQEIVDAVEALSLEHDRLKQELKEAKETIETLELGYRGFP